MSTMGLATIGVVMPVWNSERWLAEALDSVFAQTLAPAEVLLVDGGSTDATAAIAARYEGVRLLPQEGRGLAAAWNTGVRACTAEAVAFLDSDDHWVTGKLLGQASVLAADPGLDAVVGEVRFFLEDGQAPPPSFRPELLEGSHLAWMPGTSLLRRRVFDAVGGFDEALGVATDIEWFARLRQREMRVAEVRELVLHKRVHSANYSYGSARSDTYEKDLLKAIARLRAARRGAGGRAG